MQGTGIGSFGGAVLEWCWRTDRRLLPAAPAGTVWCATGDSMAEAAFALFEYVRVAEKHAAVVARPEPALPRADGVDGAPPTRRHSAPPLLPGILNPYDLAL